MNRLESFHVGQIWQGPRGGVYSVVSVQKGGKAQLATGGRKIYRDWDAVINWVLLHVQKADKGNE
jgi:hypothetical protein